MNDQDNVTDPVDLSVYESWEVETPADEKLRLDRVDKLCLFVGHPRSGHSLVGAILDSHPEAAIGHELDMLACWERGSSWPEIGRYVGLNARRAARNRRPQSGYFYSLPGQGETLAPTVLGDKKGGRTSHYLSQNPGILERFQQDAPWPVHLIHVVRDPRDNIATISKRHGLDVGAAFRSYSYRARAVQDLKSRWPRHRFFELHLEELISRPKEVLTGLCRYLELEPTDAFVEASSRLLFSKPKTTRNEVRWGETLQSVEALCGEVDFLTRYS
jgi:hypothetical protein